MSFSTGRRPEHFVVTTNFVVHGRLLHEQSFQLILRRHASIFAIVSSLGIYFTAHLNRDVLKNRAGVRNQVQE